MAINQLIIVVSFVPHWNGKFKVVPVHPIFKHIFVGSQTWLAGKFDMCPHLHVHFVQTMRNKERFGISCSHMFPNVFHHWITTWGISRFRSKHVKTICTAPLGPVSPAWYFLSNFPFDCLVDGYEGVVCWKTAVVFSFVCNTRFGPQYLLLTSPCAPNFLWDMTNMPNQCQRAQRGFLLKVRLAGCGLPPCRLQLLLGKCISAKSHGKNTKRKYLSLNIKFREIFWSIQGNVAPLTQVCLPAKKVLISAVGIVRLLELLLFSVRSFSVLWIFCILGTPTWPRGEWQWKLVQRNCVDEPC